MPQGRAVHRDTKSHDGIDYEIVVYSVPGGLYGTFTCPKCGLTEVNAVLSSTAEEALNVTRAAVAAHHAAKHAP
jgi:hypothetical protein